MRRLAGLAMLLLCLWSCYSEGELYDRPPEPREERVEPRDGFVWVHGRWERRGSLWVWRDGHYEAQRLGFEYVDGHWEPHGNLYQWVDGGWRPVKAVVPRATSVPQ